MTTNREDTTMTATTDRCPGCGGSGMEPTGVTYAGMSEYVGCHECGPECPDDCGCRASDATERPESIAPRHPGATQSPDGSQGATEHVEITPDGNVQVMTTSWHEGSPYSCARPGCPAGCDRNDPTTEAPSDVRPSPPARDAVSDAEAAEWAALADAATEGPWHVQGPSVEEDDWAVYGPTRYVRHGSAAWARGEGHPRLCSAPSGADANFIALARTAVPRLLADRERLVGANARMRQVAELRVGTWRDTAARLGGERDRAIGFATRVEAENARLRAGIEALLADVDRLTAERDGARGMRVIATRAFETTRRVLQEASGLPDDIDDPDCRDEMVLALRPRAEKAEAEVARLAEEATVSAALLETEIAKREAAEMRANRATADLDALESEDRRQDVQAKHWREVLRIRRELDGIRREMNDVTEIIAEALGYRPSGLPLDGWPHLSTTGDHTPTSLAAEAAGVLAKASRLREGIEALAAEWGKAGPGTEAERVFGRQKVSVEFAVKALRALLAEGGE